MPEITHWERSENGKYLSDK